MKLDTSIFRSFIFYLALSFLVRVYGITQPPLETAHNWRQTTVTMVARNFLETDANILYPRIDFAGELTGITGMEFPILNYLIYLASLIFGYEHWYGRLINLVITTLGIWSFYSIVKKFFNERTAFYSGLILICSIWFIYGRKIMPDTFSVSLVLCGLNAGLTAMYDPASRNVIIRMLTAGVLISLGVLSKLPAVCAAAAGAIVLFDKTVHARRRYFWGLIMVASAIPVAWWYFHWSPHLTMQYGFGHFFPGISVTQGISELITSPGTILKQFSQHATGYSGFVMFLAGCIMSIALLPSKRTNAILALSFMAFLVVMVKAGNVFLEHSYYMVPFIPVMALVTGHLLNRFNLRIRIFIVTVICLEGLMNQYHDLRINEEKMVLTRLEQQLDPFSSRTDLFLINSGEYPTPMYFAHRKGWVNSNEEIRDTGYRSELIDKGLDYILIMKHSFGSDMNLPYDVIRETDDYRVYKVD
jgi:4-amino-4-deoxy-L-arabinose transferase-like glycosyltransferase